jgi:hypothetical protein
MTEIKCKHCGATITFNRDILKWVTDKKKWKCGNDPDFPIRAHAPAEKNNDQ